MMKKPPHPGELLRENVIAELGLSVTEPLFIWACPVLRYPAS